MYRFLMKKTLLATMAVTEAALSLVAAVAGLLKNKVIMAIALPTLLVLVALAWVLAVYMPYRGYVTPFGPGTAALANQAAERIIDAFPTYDKTNKLNPIVVFPFEGPKGPVMADHLREAIDRTGRYDVWGMGPREGAIRKMDQDLPRLGEEAARSYAKKLGVKAVVTGEIVRVDERSDPPALEVRAVMRAVDGEGRWTAEFSSKAAKVEVADGSFLGNLGAAGKAALYWLGVGVGYTLLCLATPVLAYPATRRVLARQSNFANALLLAVMALLNTAALWIVVGPRNVIGAMLLVAGGFLLALILNFLSCSFIERRR